MYSGRLTTGDTWSLTGAPQRRDNTCSHMSFERRVARAPRSATTTPRRRGFRTSAVHAPRRLSRSLVVGLSLFLFSARWLIGWLVDRLVGRLVRWFAGSLGCWYTCGVAPRTPRLPPRREPRGGRGGVGARPRRRLGPDGAASLRLPAHDQGGAVFPRLASGWHHDPRGQPV